MRANRPSRTAERVALRRAAHQLLDRPLVFEDPLAVAILGQGAGTLDAAALTERFRTSGDGAVARRLRAFLAVRSRIAEDALRDAAGRGARQFVVLGAGLDTFACRNPYPQVRVFEVDHPATQAWKRERLATAGIAVPGDVAFVPVDLAAEPLAPPLEAAGFRRDLPSLFSWLGVAPYLDADAVMATLRAVSDLTAAGGGLVFDYAVSPRLLTWRERAAIAALSARVAAAGEPFRSTFDPDVLVRSVTDLGFTDVHDRDADELNATFFAGRIDDLRVGRAGRVLTAARRAAGP